MLCFFFFFFFAFLFCGGMCICVFFFFVLFYDVTNEEDRMLLISYGSDPIPYLWMCGGGMWGFGIRRLFECLWWIRFKGGFFLCDDCRVFLSDDVHKNLSQSGNFQ
jgi:hypothetical protein